MNSTNQTTYSYNFDKDLFQKLLIAVHTWNALVLVVGTFLNVWLLLAIVTSTELRVRMRNKLIISTCVLHLTECCVQVPLYFTLRLTEDLNCHVVSSYINISLIEDFISNWLLVEMIVLYICQIMDLKISESLSVLGQRIVTITVVLLPWVASLITVPAMIHSDRREYTNCFIPKSYKIFKFMDGITPLLISIVLIVVAIVKKRKRYRKGFSASNMQVELISRGTELDETSAYVVALVVSLVCDAGLIIQLLRIMKYSLVFDFCAFILENFRVVIMMLPWLLFKDIRTRMKTWRPWYWPLPGIDLTLAYGKGQDEQVNNTGQ